jgi:hypothetical protein
VPVTCPYPEPTPSSPHDPPLNFLKIHLNIIFPSTFWFSQWPLSLRLPHQHPVHTSILPHAPHALSISFVSMLTGELDSFFNFGSGSGWSRTRPGSFTSGKETRYPFYRRLSEPQGCSGRLRKISPPPSENRSADRRYTNYAIPAHLTRVGRR